MAYSLLIGLLVPVLVCCQSGGVWTDNEPTILCTSHLSVHEANSLICYFEDDDNETLEDIEQMTLSDGKIYLREKGNNITSSKLVPLQNYKLIISLKRGVSYTKSINLKNIIKPRSPWIVNATYLASPHRVNIYIGHQYKGDYLTSNNQLFQLLIWSVKNTLVPNITEQLFILEGDEYLYGNTEYHVKVRAKPNGLYFDGSWSEWSASIGFRTGPETTPEQMMLYSLTMVVVVLLLGTSAFIFTWRKQIQSFVWPSIPHPKHTLFHMYKPIKGPLVSFNPEVFSDRNIQVVEPEEEDVTARTPDSDALAEVKGQSLLQCSGETMSCSSGSSDGSDATLLRCTSPGDRVDSRAGNSLSSGSTVGILDLKSDTDSVGTDDSDGNVCVVAVSATRKPGNDEAYVTMSSFYQSQ
ncbi:hypothetical protein DPEC_G00335450 [Dallia pectoralis]|uniref:Uncharacterized protein n=1 Tax=Dallia pectoralis TaxID=75939 RepID=A0ACC2F6Y7_DALPE|nr:hypothetical protein DPEC_G00335450 [Dallia pectoralis]